MLIPFIFAIFCTQRPVAYVPGLDYLPSRILIYGLNPMARRSRRLSLGIVQNFSRRPIQCSSVSVVDGRRPTTRSWRVLFSAAWEKRFRRCNFDDQKVRMMFQLRGMLVFGVSDFVWRRLGDAESKLVVAAPSFPDDTIRLDLDPHRARCTFARYRSGAVSTTRPPRIRFG